MMKTICVAGAGTMGSGIALASARAGFDVLLFDAQQEALMRAETMIGQQVQQMLNKQRISAEAAAALKARIRYVSELNDCLADCFIEAIVEKMEVKTGLFQSLMALNGPGSIYASNTSSISITTLQESLPYPGRVVGMHFFNPAHVMKLVEVVTGKFTNPEVAEAIKDLCKKLDKTPVQCTDAPGFIVNRVARHYYLEALKLADEGYASVEQIDKIMEATGFKMGPFRLMDLIGMDINLAVSQSLYEAFDHETRFKPSPLQERKVAARELGRKTGKGFYEYS
ncbi:MAG TPA: 3-hydroxybutyryl-CoA dehydrogenase [Chitinophagaceae bacterium]|nr:3-hydroxybutyryl-CoA dehydrogenase [Chitinophagaceae bacterium]